jgi:biopolymer transport protein ExbB
MQWYSAGGPIMHVVLVVGLMGVGVLVERLYVIVVRSKNNGRIFIERVIQLVRAGKVDEAIKLCAGTAAALPDIGLLILRSRSRDESDLQNVAQAATLAVLPRLTRRLDYLHTLAVVAILVGCFGTLVRLREVLGPNVRGAPLSGAGDALIPAAFGVIVAAFLTLGRGYLVSQSEAIIEEIREFSARLINALIDRPDVRLGHR